MKKQFFWMRFKAILKIIIPIGIAIPVVPELFEGDLTEAIVICCTMGLAGLIYVISGILTLKNGPKQAMRYIRNYPGGADALDEEFEKGEQYSTARIGHKHLFANASDGFYIIPFEKIENVFVRHEGANPAKGRSGYYYLYVRCDGIGGWDDTIKVYFLSEDNANEAMEVLMQKAGIPQKTEEFVQENEQTSKE